MDPDRLLREEDEGWHRLHEVFERIPHERFEEGTVTPAGWSPKDVMFHVGGWLADCHQVLEQIGEGTFEANAEEDVEGTNQAWFERSRTMAAVDVRAQFEASRQQARAAFGTLSVVTSEAWEWFEESGSLHYAKHVDDLETWLGLRP